MASPIRTQISGSDRSRYPLFAQPLDWLRLGNIQPAHQAAAPFRYDASPPNEQARGVIEVIDLTAEDDESDDEIEIIQESRFASQPRRIGPMAREIINQARQVQNQQRDVANQQTEVIDISSDEEDDDDLISAEEERAADQASVEHQAVAQGLTEIIDLLSDHEDEDNEDIDSDIDGGPITIAQVERLQAVFAQSSNHDESIFTQATQSQGPTTSQRQEQGLPLFNDVPSITSSDWSRTITPVSPSPAQNQQEGVTSHDSDSSSSPPSLSIDTSSLYSSPPTTAAVAAICSPGTHATQPTTPANRAALPKPRSSRQAAGMRGRASSAGNTPARSLEPTRAAVTTSKRKREDEDDGENGATSSSPSKKMKKGAAPVTN